MPDVEVRIGKKVYVVKRVGPFFRAYLVTEGGTAELPMREQFRVIQYGKRQGLLA